MWSPYLQRNLELSHQPVSKLVATTVWDSEGLSLIDYLPPKKTITGQYYAELTFKLLDASNRNAQGNCHWVFGFFTTMRQFINHLLHSKLFVTVDLFN